VVAAKVNPTSRDFKRGKQRTAGAGLRSKKEAGFQILRAIRYGDIRIAVSVALVVEYEAVVLRPGLVPAFSPVDIGKIIDGLCRLADHQQVFFAWRPFLQDPDDDLVLELADFDRLLAMVPDTDPDPGDELPPKSNRRTRRAS
jgi:hypothetical protein